MTRDLYRVAAGVRAAFSGQMCSVRYLFNVKIGAETSRTGKGINEWTNYEAPSDRDRAGVQQANEDRWSERLNEVLTAMAACRWPIDDVAVGWLDGTFGGAVRKPLTSTQ